MGNDLISIDTGDFVLFQSTFPRGERPSSSTRIPFLSQFQSTFPRGERRLECRVWKSIIYFNPRSRVGNDVKSGKHTVIHSIISIHVPAWGTTIQSECPRAALRFQSTFPRGERHSHTNVLVVHLLHFNPRSRVGNDSSGFSILRKISISIHVPAWGTTL